MDKKELEYRLSRFNVECERRKYPLQGICLEEAYPGDSSTSYILQVRANWVDDMPCDEALNILSNVLFDTTDVETRKKIFYIQVLDSHSELHCQSTHVTT